MSLTNQQITEAIQAKFPDAVRFSSESWGMLSLEIDAKQILAVSTFLRDDAVLRFNFLTTLCGMHHPENDATRQFAVVYHFHNWMDNVRIRITCFLSAQPEIDSLSSVFLSANWQERETYDFYGIIFNNHPDLKRILNMDEMVSFPLRKEFPLEDANRTDKNDIYFGRTPNNTELTTN